MKKLLSLFLLSSLVLAACENSTDLGDYDGDMDQTEVNAAIEESMARNVTLGDFLFFALEDWTELETSEEDGKYFLTAKVPDSQYDVTLNVRLSLSSTTDYFYDTVLKEQTPEFVSDGGQKFYSPGCGGALTCHSFEFNSQVYNIDSWVSSNQEVPAEKDGPFLYDTDINRDQVVEFLETMWTK